MEVMTGAAFYQARVVPSGIQATTFTGLRTGRTYVFRVRAKTAAGYSSYSGTASVVPSEPAPNPPARGTLTSAQVACDAGRLAGLLGRMAAVPGGPGGTGMNLTFTGSGDFAGVAYTPADGGSPERHLAFSTNPEETTLLRNPERPQLASVSLSRNVLNSDLVPATASAGLLRVLLDPTLSPGSGGGGVLAIDNRNGAHGGSTDARPGRGLAGLIAPCHAGLSERDVHVLRVLSKLLRVETAGAAAHKVAIYRGAEAGVFRIDAYPQASGGAGWGRLAAELEIAFGPGDELRTGTLRLLERCRPGGPEACTSVTRTTRLSLVVPARPGDSREETGATVTSAALGSGAGASAAVEFDGLLAGTTWRRPL